MTIFNTENHDHLKSEMFLDNGGNLGVARYEQVKYPQFDKFVEQQLSFFWRPEEIDLAKDKNDFIQCPPHLQHIFTSNLFRQILLDSIQGRGPNLALLPITTLPELEGWIECWGFNETIHSRSYTHIIRNIYSDPTEIFNEIIKIPEILQCAHDISQYYDALIDMNAKLANKDSTYNEYEHREALWLCLNSINALEGLRFYVSFSCSWNFSEQKLLEGNAKIIQLICRDENIHLGSTQYILRTLLKDNPIYQEIREKHIDTVVGMFDSVITQEKEWAKYLFQHGSMIGLSEEILGQYVDFLASKRMKTLGLPIHFEHPKSDPLPWTKNWISSQTVQVAPQEAEITSYLISDIDRDVGTNDIVKMLKSF